MNIINWLSQPWPWYISGPLIGLMVPVLLLSGNKTFGISSKIPFCQYDWKKEIWNLFFVTGILLGGIVVALFLQNPEPVQVNPKLVSELQRYGITNYQGLVPAELFNWENLLSLKGFIMMIVGGFLVGFGTRYAGGCT